NAHGRVRDRPRTHRHRAHERRRRPRVRRPRGRRPGGAALLAAPPLGGIPAPARQQHRGHQEHRREAGGHDHGRPVPQGIRPRRGALGPSRHCGHRVSGRGPAVPRQGCDRRTDPAVHRVGESPRSSMIQNTVHDRPRHESMASRLAVVLFFFSISALPAQEPPPVRPPPPDPPDSAVVVPDSVALDTLVVQRVDSGGPTAAPLGLVRFPATRSAGWAEATWVWERADILNSGAFSLSDLLERVVGVAPIRSGLYGVPEIAAPFGANPERVRIFLDGFELDPLISGTYDLSRIELVHLERVTVHRDLDALRVELETMTLDDPRPYSIIEAGTGDYRTNQFRGAFLAPRLLGGPVSLGVDHLETQGTGFDAPASAFSGWVKWALIRGAHGLEVEYRRSSIERELEQTDETSALRAGEGQRSDVIVRARTAPFQGFVAEAFYGSS